MKPTDTGKAYDQITHLWEDHRFNSDNGIKQHQQAIEFVSNRGAALDVGCGSTGRLIELLLAAGFTPEGLDVSATMISLAKAKHPELTFYHQDICSWPITQPYDLISAWDSLWHVPLAQQKTLLTKLINALNPGGVLIFSCGGTDTAGDHVDDAMGPSVYYATLGVNGYLQLLLESGCAVRHFAYDQYPEQHAYFIVQKPQ